MNFLARLGLVRFRFNFVENNNRNNNAVVFKKKYLKKLKGNFYKEKLKEDIEMKSCLLQDDFIKSDEIEKIEKAISCNLNLKLKKTKIEDYEKKKFEDSENICSICFSQFNDLAYVLELPECKHVFHFKCVVSWLETNPSCPCCRSDLLGYFRNLENQEHEG